MNIDFHSQMSISFEAYFLPQHLRRIPSVWYQNDRHDL